MGFDASFDVAIDEHLWLKGSGEEHPTGLVYSRECIYNQVDMNP